MEFDKNVPFMMQVGQLVRQLRGAKCIFCKSGKDRCVASVAPGLTRESCFRIFSDVLYL